MAKNTLKIMSWNVNGIRAVIRKEEFQKFIDTHKPDILCLQETKANRDQVEIDLPDYEEYWNSSDMRKGYAGTAIFTKVKPISIRLDIDPDVAAKYEFEDDFGNGNKEGRVIAAEFDSFYLATVYTPNAKDDLGRLDYRHKLWDPAFLEYMQLLEQDKPVLYCGDLNVAHKEIDLARPKPNKGKKGFTDEEREGFDNMLEAGFFDTLRAFTEEPELYTWWTHWGKARERNVGWRIDYFLASNSIKDAIISADIHPEVMGSDHCPVSVVLDLDKLN